MQSRRASLLAAFCVFLLPSQVSHARIVEVIPVGGAPAQVIDAPAQVMDSVFASPRMTDFDERQNVQLETDLAVDGRTLPKGTRIDSHMILFNVPDDDPGGASENIRVFSKPVLGVMSDVDGQAEAASAFLGASGTAYPRGAFPNRGFEERDRYEGVGTTRLKVHMWVWQPGDWIRVITGEQPVADVLPAPGNVGQVAGWPE